MANTGQSRDPYPAFMFAIEIDGITQAVFSECSGLEAETEVFEYKEGGLNTYVHKLPGRTKFANLTLKSGTADSDELWDWYKSVRQGKVERKNLSVILFDTTGTEVRRWNFSEAYPVKWTGPAFNASEGNVAIDALEIAHHGMEVA